MTFLVVLVVSVVVAAGVLIAVTLASGIDDEDRRNEK